MVGVTEKPLHEKDPTLQNHLALTWQLYLAEGQSLETAFVTVFFIHAKYKVLKVLTK